MKKKVFILPLGLLLTLMVLLTGCTTVQPWQREILSEPIMRLDDNPLDKAHHEHYKVFHEGSKGATGSQGGGCGCG